MSQIAGESRVLTLEPLRPRAPARGAEPAAQLLEVHVPVSVLVEREERARHRRGRQRGGQQGGEALDVELAGRRRVAQRPETFL